MKANFGKETRPSSIIIDAPVQPKPRADSSVRQSVAMIQDFREFETLQKDEKHSRTFAPASTDHRQNRTRSQSRKLKTDP